MTYIQPVCHVSHYLESPKNWFYLSSHVYSMLVCFSSIFSTLAPDDICHACGYKSSNGKWRQPQWRDPPGGQKYYTSYNLAPGAHVYV